MKITPEIELHVIRCDCGKYFGAESRLWLKCQSCRQREADEWHCELVRLRGRHARVVRGLRQYIARLKRELDR